MRRTIVCIIPIYKKQLTETEEASLRQCFKVLKSYPLVFVTYPGLGLDYYYKFSRENGIIPIFEFFPSVFFTSVKGYNQLCLSPEFYVRFDKYEYMLIYQLDAWIFRDELQKWASYGYDFIGAPWFAWDRRRGCLSKRRFIFPVGNGGFSLRRVKYCSGTISKCLSSSPRHVRLLPWSRMISLLLHRQFSVFKVLIRYHDLEAFYNAALSFEIAEDVFFAYQKYTCLGAKLPSVKVAMAFSFEQYPSVLYQMNDGKLPCGCHAFERNEWNSFWKKYIPSSSS